MIKQDLIDWMLEIQEKGAGEIIVTSVDQEGTWGGVDLDLMKKVSDILDIPVIAQGGIGSVEDIIKIFERTSVSGVGLGSLVCFQGKGKGVLINFPEIDRKLKVFL